jgi:hypothetical protein
MLPEDMGEVSPMVCLHVLLRTSSNGSSGPTTARAEAIELLEEHETLAEGEPVDPAVVEALAHAYSTRGDLAAALALVERQLTRADEDPVTRFRLTVTLTNILIDLGHLDRAEALVGDELAKLGSAPNTVALARCLWSQSRLLKPLPRARLGRHARGSFLREFAT